MKNSLLIIISFAITLISINAFAQSNTNTNSNPNTATNPNNISNTNTNSNTGTTPGNQQNPVITTPPVQNNVGQPIPASGGTEPNNRVMLKSQTDSMDSKRTSKPNNIRVTGDTIGTNRSRMRNDNPLIYPGRKDSLR